MKPRWGRVLPQWLAARRGVIAHTVVVFLCFFAVYGLYGYEWGVAGYAALLALAAGAGFAIVDFARFAARHAALCERMGKFPTAPLPPPRNRIEADYTEMIQLLEAERARVAAGKDAAARDAEEYYTLWAHQIKTPLSALGLLVQSGKDDPGSTITGMEQELFRVGQYVDMVLQYQRLSSLQNDLVLERFETAALVKRAAKNCATLFIHRGLPLDTGGVRGSIITDEKWFVFVLEQLYSNAVKYTPSGSVRVYSEGGDTLVIEDTGIGIPPEDLPRVFERGFTGAAGRSERSSTGIGLYLCRRILGRLGFGIRLESQPGQGTRVLLSLAQDVQETE